MFHYMCLLRAINDRKTVKKIKFKFNQSLIKGKSKDLDPRDEDERKKKWERNYQLYT